MSCFKMKSRITLYVGGDLSEKEKIKLLAHLDKCPDCRDKLEEFTRFKKVVDTISNVDKPVPLPANFTAEVYLGIKKSRIKKILPKREKWHYFNWKPVFAVSLIVVLVIIAGILYNIQKEQKRMAVKMYEQIERIIEKDPSVVRLDNNSMYMKLIKGPYRFNEWKSPDEEGIFIILHRTDPVNDPSNYTIDYIGDSDEILHNKRTWKRQRINELISRTVSEDNIYIGVYDMPNSSPSDRRKIVRTLVRTYKPYFNNNGA